MNTTESPYLFILSVIVLLFIILRPRKETVDVPPLLKESGLWVLLLISIVGLYAELLLIRWIGTEIRIFAFVQNLTLVACFLGFGVGCYRSEKPGSLLPSLEKLAVLALIITLPVDRWQLLMLNLSNLLTLSPDAALWGDIKVKYTSQFTYLEHVGLAIVMVSLMLWLVAETMVPLGRWIGYCFDRSSNTVRTYTVNLAGSLLGTWLLVGMSVLNMSPIWWVSLAFLLVLAATPRDKMNWLTGLALLIPILVLIQFQSAGVYWSPYQKLSIKQEADPTEGYYVKVNNVGYMTMANTTPDYMKTHPDFKKHYLDSSYDSPFKFINPGAKVLIVGAGAGNDASVALRHGASHVDAVEIDPMIYLLGKDMHPDHPYADPKVNVVINDARNFLRRSTDKYDAIIFGLLDSHTEVSGYTNMRVDNYVYTKDSFEQAARLLKPDGIMALKFEVRQPWTWIGDRFYHTLTEVFGREPLTYYAPPVGPMLSGTVFLESFGKQLWKDAEKPELRQFVKTHAPLFVPSQNVTVATDDWPYPYNRDHSVPRTYLTVSFILLVVAYFMVRKDFVMRERDTWAMFFLGAGFMLMETQLVCRLTLYFGTTWVVNSIAVSTVLAVLVFANFILEHRKTPIDRRPVFVVLLISIVANYFIPWQDLPFTPWMTGALLSGAFAVTILMAGLIFTTTLQKAGRKSSALGANVMGAVAGGLSQNLSFIIGLKALLPVAALCYACAGAFALARRK